MTRLTCLVPFCHHTRKPLKGEPDQEWICDHHFDSLPVAMKREYNAAWEKAEEADLKNSGDLSIYQRVTRAWERCKTEAIARAGGLS